MSSIIRLTMDQPGGPLMNAFYEHHRHNIRWQCRCFDRILLNGLIQLFQQPERVVGFFNTYRQLYPVSRHVLRDIAEQSQRWLKGWSEKRNIPIAEAPTGRRDDFVEPYFKRAAPDAVVIIVKAREPAAINDNYLNVQQDILETFIDRGQLRKLAQPTITPTGKRIPGLKLDHPRQFALMHALVRFAHIAGFNTFTTAELYPRVLAARGCAAERYTLASLRYDLAKLRAKGLVAKLPRSRRYQLLAQGYSICLIFLKLFERVYAPLTAGLLSPVSADRQIDQQKRSQLDRLYQRILDDLDALVRAVGLKAA